MRELNVVVLSRRDGHRFVYIYDDMEVLNALAMIHRAARNPRHPMTRDDAEVLSDRIAGDSGLHMLRQDMDWCEASKPSAAAWSWLKHYLHIAAAWLLGRSQ